MTAEITYVSNYNDWEGLYINGKLCNEGTDLSVGRILEALDEVGVIHYSSISCNPWWLEDNGGFLPIDLQDVEVT